jgi:hypothetical protein
MREDLRVLFDKISIEAHSTVHLRRGRSREHKSL